MQGATGGPPRCTGGGSVAAVSSAGPVSGYKGGSNITPCNNLSRLPHLAEAPPSFPPQGSFGALRSFADAAFELQNRKGGACPQTHELLQLMDPAEPCLICLTALHAKNKTIITVSDGLCWCRVASTQLPPVPSTPDGRPGGPPDEEQLNMAAADLAGSLLRLSQLSITRTPRGKHIILCRAFHVLSRDCKALARALQAQQRPEVLFPMWTEGTATTSVQQPQQQSLQQQRPPQQQSYAQEPSRGRQQGAYPPEGPPTNPTGYHQHYTQGPQSSLQQAEAYHQPSQRGSGNGGFQQGPPATGYQQHTLYSRHSPGGQQHRHVGQGPEQPEEESPQQQPLPNHRAPMGAQPPQQPSEQQRLQSQHQQQDSQYRLPCGDQSVPAAALSSQQSPQRYSHWQKPPAQHHAGTRNDRELHEQQHQQQRQACGSTRDQFAGPCQNQEQERPRERQEHEGPSPYSLPVDSHEENSVAGNGPQRQPAILPTYRSAPYPPSRPQSVQQQRAQHGVRASTGGESFIPIKDLTAYVAKWTIRARVDVKADIRKYSNARGPGQLFNVELRDKSGEIRATFFNAAVDRWFNFLQEGKVYYFRGGAVKAKNPRFNTTRHNYEITFDEKASILETQDEGDIPSSSSGTVDIKGIDAMQETNMTISMTAIVHDYRPMQSITIKATGQLKPKRDVYLVDESGMSICLTLWGDKAKEILEDQLAERPVVFFKNVKVGDWNGKKLDSQNSTRIELYPNDDRGKALQEWWSRDGCNQLSFQLMSSSSGAAVGRKEALKTLEQVGREAVQMDPAVIADKGAYFSCSVLLERVADERFSWPACPECRKKMVETVAHMWSCANCGRQFEQPNHTYMLNIMLMDSTGSLRCTCMGEKAEEVMGFVKAETLLLLQDHQSLDEQGRSFSDIFADVNLEEWIFRLCSKNDTYMDEMRLKHRVVALTPLFRRVGDQTRHRLDFIKNTFAHLRIPCIALPLSHQGAYPHFSYWTASTARSPGRSPYWDAMVPGQAT